MLFKAVRTTLTTQAAALTPSTPALPTRVRIAYLSGAGMTTAYARKALHTEPSGYVTEDGWHIPLCDTTWEIREDSTDSTDSADSTSDHNWTRHQNCGWCDYADL